MNYFELNDLKTWLSIGTADTTDDGPLSVAGSAACQAIDEFCGRSFVAAGTVASVRYFAATDAWLCSIDDLGSTTDLVVAVDLEFDGTYSTTIPSSDYQLETPNAIDKGVAAVAIRVRRNATNRFAVAGAERLVKVTGRWGWPAVPAVVKQAGLIQAARFHSRRRSPLGSIQAPELGGGERLLQYLDPDVQVLVERYRRSWHGLSL